MKSLRLRLILLLSLGLGAVWGIAVWLGHIEARDEVDKLFDAQLAQSAQAILTITRHEIHERLEHGSDEAQEPGQTVFHQYEQPLVFQLWNQDGRLLQRSPDAPESMMASPAAGYQVVSFHNQSWRVLVRFDHAAQLMVQVAEPLDGRERLARHIVLQILLPILLAMPLLALLIWWFVGTGLKPLQRISRELQSRQAYRLDQLELKNVPEEAIPLATALNDLFMRLGQAFDNERRFTADAAHELRTPLAALKVQAQVALRSTDDQERQTALEKVVQGVDRTTRLVAQLLTLARVDPESAASQYVRLTVKPVAEQVLNELMPLAESRNIRLQLQGTGFAINGDPDQLAVLLRNLLDNALRYTPEGGEVQLLLHADDGRIEIADSGPGIAPELRERVMERFYRIPGNTQTGSGLGLAIAKRIAELHGAVITLATSSSGGLSVLVEFPHHSILAG